MFGRNKSSGPAQKSSLRQLFPRAVLCYVTDRRGLSNSQDATLRQNADAIAGISEKIAALVAAGIDWIQIREKDLPENELFALTKKAVALASARCESIEQLTGIFVNDRLDAVRETKPLGVHFGEHKSLTEAFETLATNNLHRDLFIGQSCHSLESAIAAQRDGADYLFFGPVFPTPSKAAFGPPQGLDRLAAICQAVQIPVLAIGGITQENFDQCLQAGAAGIAAIRLFQDSPDPAATIRSLRQALS